jgi:hypothetical protein
MRSTILALVLLTSRDALAQHDSVLVSENAIIRVWSANHAIKGREGRVTRRFGDTVDVRLLIRGDAIETHWETMTLVPRDVDSLDVFLNEQWFRVDMRSGGGLEPPATRTGDIVTGDQLRLWSTTYRLFDHDAQVIRAPGDTLDVWLGADYTDREQLLRANLDRIAIRRMAGGGVYKGIAKGVGIGLLGTSATALLMKGMCSSCDIKRNVAAFAIAFGTVGGIAGGMSGRPHEEWVLLKEHPH